MRVNATLIGSPDGPERVQVIETCRTHVTVRTATDGHVELPAVDGQLANGMELVPFFRDVEAIRHALDAQGSQWFLPATMRYWKSRLSSTVHGGRFFVSSERSSSDSPRAYTVRVVTRDSHGRLDVETADGTTLGQFPSLRAAHAAARQLATATGTATS